MCCTMEPPPVLALSPRGVIRRDHLHAVVVSFDIGQEVVTERASIKFWDARGLLYAHELEPEYHRMSISSRLLPGWARAMSRSVGVVRWTWDAHGARDDERAWKRKPSTQPRPRASFRVVDVPMEQARRLDEVGRLTQGAAPWIRSLVRAQCLVDQGLLDAGRREVGAVRKQYPREPHALALLYRIIRGQGLDKGLIGAPELRSKEPYEFDAVTRLADAKDAGGVPLRPGRSRQAVQRGCAGRRLPLDRTASVRGTQTPRWHGS